MAFNVITGSVGTMGDVVFGQTNGGITITGSFSGTGENLTEVPRVSNSVNNGIVTNVGGDANTLTCESNLKFDGSSATLDITGHLTASQGISGSYFLGDGSKLTGLPMGGESFTHYSSSRGDNTVLVATASISVAGDLGTAYSASQAGTDTFFFVSGTIGSRGSAVPGVSLFGGDVHVSGNLSTTSIFATGNLNLQGSGSIAGDLIPHEGNIYDLGTSAKPWRNLYVSSSTIYFGNESLSVEDNNLKFGSGSTTKGLDVGFMNFKNNGIFMDPGRIFQLRAYQMQFYGGVSYVRQVIADDYKILKIDYLVGVASNLLTASVKLTLPAAAACINGQTFVIKDEGGSAHTYNINVSASSSDTIDGVNEVVLKSPYGALSLYCNGSNKWYVF